MHILIIATACAPDRGGAALRVFNWVQTIQKDVRVSLLTLDQKENPLTAQNGFLTKAKRLWTYYQTGFILPRPDKTPDIVQIHTPYLWGLSKYFPGLPKIFVAHDVNWNLLKYDLPHAPTFKKFPLKRFLVPWTLWRAKQFEKKAFLEASHSFTCSEQDKKTILTELPHIQNKISAVPNCIVPSRYEGGETPGEYILFMGPFSYSANRDAAEIICKQLAPRLPHLPFKILGGNDYPKVPPKNVEFLGFVQDALPILKEARVCIVPLRFGSGTRWKILESWAMKRAVVSTSKGAEGLEAAHGKNIWIADHWDTFAKAIGHLWTHPEEARRLGHAGRQLVEEKYNYIKYKDHVVEVYQNVHRQ